MKTKARNLTIDEVLEVMPCATSHGPARFVPISSIVFHLRKQDVGTDVTAGTLARYVRRIINTEFDAAHEEGRVCRIGRRYGANATYQGRSEELVQAMEDQYAEDAKAREALAALPDDKARLAKKALNGDRIALAQLLEIR